MPAALIKSASMSYADRCEKSCQTSSWWGFILVILDLPSKRKSAGCVDYIPARCTHRPSLLRFSEIFRLATLRLARWMPKSWSNLVNFITGWVFLHLWLPLWWNPATLHRYPSTPPQLAPQDAFPCVFPHPLSMTDSSLLSFHVLPWLIIFCLSMCFSASSIRKHKHYVTWLSRSLYVNINIMSHD